MTKRRPDRQELEKLLPWHAARTLSRREADLVERALAADAELAQCYALVRQELADTIHLNETLGAPSARAMQQLFAAIEAEEVRAQAVSESAERVLGHGPAHNASPSDLLRAPRVTRSRRGAPQRHPL